MKNRLRQIGSAVVLAASPLLALATPPSQPDMTDVSGFLTAAIPTITGVAAAALALFISVKIFKWVRRAL